VRLSILAEVRSDQRAFLSADLLEQLKAQLEPLLFAAVSVKFNSYEYELQYAQMKVQVLEERLRQQRIAKYGPQRDTEQPSTGVVGS